MRFNTTEAFAKLRVRVDQALAVHTHCFNIDSNSSATTRAVHAYGDAVKALVECPAITADELVQKIDIMVGSNFHHYAGGGEAKAFAALRADVERLKEYPVSPKIAGALSTWRTTQEMCFGAGEEKAHFFEMAFIFMMNMPCVTPGDFIAKTYINLIRALGSTYRKSGTGNLFDIDLDTDIDQNAGDDILEERWYRAAYQDIEHSDLGANLLAYGLPTFSAFDWVERAEMVDLKIGVMIDADGKRSFSITSPDQDNSALSRERYRLERIWAFDLTRTGLLIEEIVANWPHLVTAALVSPELGNFTLNPDPQYRGIMIDTTHDAGNDVAETWLSNWSAVGGSYTIGSGRTHLLPWLTFDADRAAPETAARLMAELHDTPGLAYAIANLSAKRFGLTDIKPDCDHSSHPNH